MIRPASWLQQGQSVVPGKHQIMSAGFVTRQRARCRACGFTLVELMITIAVAAVLAMIGVPSFRNLILSNRLTTNADAMVDALNVARMDAIKLNATTQFCGSTGNGSDTLGTACGTNTGAVYELPRAAASAGLVRATGLNLDSQIQLSGAVAAIRFSGQGFGYVATGSASTPFNVPTVAIICTPALSSNNRRVINMTAGSIITVTPATGSCP